MQALMGFKINNVPAALNHMQKKSSQPAFKFAIYIYKFVQQGFWNII